MKTYIGMRSERTGNCTVRIVEDGDARELPLRLDIANHSPTGFEWGYGGSGPAQLAIALIADAMGGSRADVLRLHQRFKWAVVGRLPRTGFHLTEMEVIAAIGIILAKESSS